MEKAGSGIKRERNYFLPYTKLRHALKWADQMARDS
jgi:hypothetical protein